MEQLEETWQRGKRKVKHHLETSPAETFRVVEEEGEAEEQQGIAEEPPIPRIGEGVRTAMRKNIETGMIHSQLVPVRARRLRKMSLGGTKTIVTIVTPRRNLRIKTPLGTLQKTMKRGKGQEAQAPEERDIAEGIEA